MSKGADNERFAREAQRWLKGEGHDLSIDGWAGANTRLAFELETGTEHPWPEDNDAALIEFYGERGDNLTQIRSPYPMRLAWEPTTIVTKLTVNRRCASSLERILFRILGHYGSQDEVAAARMNLFGGIYNNRKMRGSTKWSRHAWSCAIDLDPDRNGLYTAWPSVASMPEAVVEIFEAEGWLSGARAWSRDAMHFQATR